MAESPRIVVIAGPNGAGKSTCASRYLPPGLVYVNADEVAKGLPGYPSSMADVQAARIVLEMMDGFEDGRESFAVETTLATRSLAARIQRLRRSDYEFHLIFVWSPSADFSVQRVAARVQAGGHHIPEETIRRRYRAGIKNFFALYQPLADLWEVLDNSGADSPRLVAAGREGGETAIYDIDLWTLIRERGSDESE